MLSHINIRGLAIIDELDVSFSAGLNVITGETGAGKSILIKALTLLLGGKANAEQVRQGKTQAVVSGVFNVPSKHTAIATLQELGLGALVNAEDPELILRRQITANGRSQAWINDTPVSAQTLTAVGLSLLDIFGQHENQKMLDVRQHVHYLDLFLPNHSTLENFQSCYAQTKDLLSSLRSTIEQVQSWARDKDYWAFRLQELTEFAPTPEDFRQCSDLCQSVRGAKLRQDRLRGAQATVDEGLGGHSLAGALWTVAKQIERSQGGLDDPTLEEIYQASQAIAQKLDDLSFSIAQALKADNLDDAKLEAAQERLATYQDLFRKLCVSDAEQLSNELSRLKQRIADVEQAEQKIVADVEQLLKNASKAAAAAAKLSDSRSAAFKKLKKLVEVELADLAMPDARLDLQRDPISKILPGLDLSAFSADVQAQWAKAAELLGCLSSNGSEKLQFLMAANRGEATLPLQKVASGGEVARIMLALKRALSIDAQTCVLVFDEIDTGISGKVADIVGAKLADLAGKFQVLCISHLPQVAAYADAHLKVIKGVKGERTESTILRLSTAESTEELARLLSGKEVTKSSLEHARTLREKAHQK